MAGGKMMPRGLAKDGPGQRLWRDITCKWELTEREYRLLEDACFTKDRILKERRCIGDKLMIPGSMGQLVPHPMLKELRADESHLAQLLAKIDMPEPEADEKQDSGDGGRSAQMRAVVNSRWQKAYG